MGPNNGMGVLTGTPPVIAALKEGSRAFDSRGFVLGDRISHINPNLAGGRPHPALDILGDAAAAESELSRLQGDLITRVWVLRAARAAPVARKPPCGIFGITFVTVLADGKERLFVKNTEPGSAAHMCGGLPPGCRIIAVCGTETNSSTVAAQLLGELPVGEVGTFEVDHTHWYDGGTIRWWPHRDAATAPPKPTPKLVMGTDCGDPFASEAACRGLEFIFQLSKNSQKFADFGGDMMQTFYDVGAVAPEPLRKQALQRMELLSQKWKQTYMTVRAKRQARAP